jgi:hypothetical protein
LGQELAGPPILYQGRLLDASRVQGTWLIEAWSVRLADGKLFRLPGAAGYWCAEFVTGTLDANPAGGPATELFDKSRLTAGELADVEPPQMCCLGEFSAAEAEQWASRLAAAEIYVSFGVNQSEPTEDAASDGPVRMYVRAEVEAAARRVLTNQSGNEVEMD